MNYKSNYMKKIAFIGLLYVMVFNASGQIGINTNDPDTSVVLDIFSTTKGILIPNMTTSVRLSYGTNRLTDGVIVYDAQMRNFFVWSNTKDDLRWKLINPWVLQKDVLGTGGHLILPDSIASQIEIEGALSVIDSVIVKGQLHIYENPSFEKLVSLKVDGDASIDGFFKSDVKVLTPSKFIGYGTIPIGGIIMWSGSPTSLPDGWELCDGGEYTDWQGNPAQIPDLSGRFIVSYGSTGGTFYYVNMIGGYDINTLQLNQIPNHSHTVGSLTGTVTSEYSAHTHSITEIGGTGNDIWGWDRNSGASLAGHYNKDGSYPYNDGPHTHGFSLTGNTGSIYNYTGSQQYVDNRPKYYALAFIIRTK
jgi:hypothetical protein